MNFNSGRYLANALSSLAQQTFRDFEVIVLDNASQDGSTTGLDIEGVPGFRLMEEETNHGFAKGNNQAAEGATGEWLVLLNPDAVAEPDWLSQIDSAIARYPDVSMFACCQMAMDAPGYLDGVGDAYLAYGFPWRGGFGRKADVKPGEGTVFGPCGASAVYRRAMFERLGGFDDRFFCYCEDVDLAFRFQLNGESCIFLPDAVVHHAGSAITGRESDFTLYHGTRNRIWVYFQNMPSFWLSLTLPMHAILSGYLLARACMTGRGAITAKAMREGYGSAVQGRRRMRALRRNRAASLLGLARAMSWNPWAMSGHAPHVQQLKS